MAHTAAATNIDIDSGEAPLPSRAKIKTAVEALGLLADYYQAAGYDPSNISETPATGMRKSSLLRAAQEILIGKPPSGKSPSGKPETDTGKENGTNGKATTN